MHALTGLISVRVSGCTAMEGAIRCSNSSCTVPYTLSYICTSFYGKQKYAVSTVATKVRNS